MRRDVLALASLLALAPALAGCLEEAPPPGTEPPTTAPPESTLPPPTPTTTPGEEPPPTEEPVERDVSDVTTRTLAEGSYSGWQNSIRRVFDNPAAWELFWEHHASAETPRPEMPAVDFTRERVVAVVLSEKPNACWATRITNVTASQDADGTEAVLVEVTTYAPPTDRVCASVMTQPHHFIAITKAETDVRFTEREAEGPVPEPAFGP